MHSNTSWDDVNIYIIMQVIWDAFEFHLIILQYYPQTCFLFFFLFLLVSNIYAEIHHNMHCLVFKYVWSQMKFQ